MATQEKTQNSKTSTTDEQVGETTSQTNQETSGNSTQNQNQNQNQNIQTRNVNCSQCGAVYALPRGATSWRCKNCRKFNDLDPWCSIL